MVAGSSDRYESRQCDELEEKIVSRQVGFVLLVLKTIIVADDY